MSLCVVDGILHEGGSDSLVTSSRIGDDSTDTASGELRCSHAQCPFMKDVASELFTIAECSSKLLRAIFWHCSDKLCPVLDAGRRGVGGECLVCPLKVHLTFGWGGKRSNKN